MKQELLAIDLHAKGQVKFKYDQPYKDFTPNQVYKVFIIHYKHPITIEPYEERIEFVIGKDIYAEPNTWLHFKNIDQVLKFLDFIDIQPHKSHIRQQNKRTNPFIERLKSY